MKMNKVTVSLSDEEVREAIARYVSQYYAGKISGSVRMKGADLGISYPSFAQVDLSVECVLKKPQQK